ncbi:MAG: rhodanese-like domain-containing protein [Trueperaceae bacterium]|nr:rhodanese-like domain-containing protein [Trueperaceae bacterium]
MISDVLSRPLFWVVAIAVAAAVAALWVFARPQAGASALTHVSVEQLHEAAQAGALVLDVREPFEYAEGHVEGSVLVPLATVAARAGEFPKDEPVYVFCRSGNRSLQAAQTLVAAGFSDVRNVEGGILAWTAARLPVAR